VVRITLIIIMFASANSFAASQKAQVNKVDNLFKNNINDQSSLERNLQEASKAAIDNMQTGNQNIDIAGSSETDAKTRELSGINALDLESKGHSSKAAEEFNKGDERSGGSFLVNHKEAGISAHKRDIDEIVNATEDLMGKLTSALKEQGIDCKEIESDRHIDQQWYIQRSGAREKEVTYDKFFCEHPRKQYKCRDEVTLTCKSKRMEWGEWQDRTIILSGHEICAYHYHWLYPVFWKRKRYGMHMRGDAHIMAEVRREIAAKLGTPVESIHEWIGISERGDGELTEAQEHQVKWDWYTFQYKYRDGKLVCQDWQETWREQCTLE
jgi:hypothetical protein